MSINYNWAFIGTFINKLIIDYSISYQNICSSRIIATTDIVQTFKETNLLPSILPDNVLSDVPT